MQTRWFISYDKYLLYLVTIWIHRLLHQLYPISLNFEVSGSDLCGNRNYDDLLCTSFWIHINEYFIIIFWIWIISISIILLHWLSSQFSLFHWARLLPDSSAGWPNVGPTLVPGPTLAQPTLLSGLFQSVASFSCSHSEGLIAHGLGCLAVWGLPLLCQGGQQQPANHRPQSRNAALWLGGWLQAAGWPAQWTREGNIAVCCMATNDRECLYLPW